MNQNERNSLAYRILAGTLRCKVGGITYCVRPQTVDIINRANEVYDSIVNDESFEEGFLSEQQINMLIGIPNIDEQIKNMYTRQEDLKVEMYEAYLNNEVVDKLRKTLKMVADKSLELYYKKHEFDYLTLEGYAAIFKGYFLLAETLYTLDGQKVITTDIESADYLFLDNVSYVISVLGITHEQMREISRTDPWRSYWNVGKAEMFGKPAIELTEDQRSLISYSKFYDSVLESPDCPNDTIIEDNDLLDGWLIKGRRERDKDKKTKEIDKLLGTKHQKDSEIFLPVTSAEAAKHIDELNTPLARQQKQQRERIIQARGVVEDKEFPDVQIDSFLNKGNKR